MTPDDIKRLMSCFKWRMDCNEQPIWVVEWRKDYFDPYLTGREGTMAANGACDKHLKDLIDWVRRDFDGHLHVMSVEFYAYARVEGREATTGEGLGAAWRWPKRY